MEKKNFNELTWEEERDFSELIAAWLQNYTMDVIAKVYPKFEEIYNNEFAMHLLRELKTRTEKEKKFMKDDFLFIVRHSVVGEPLEEYIDVHNHPLQHSESYRDVLYDMYIREQ